MDNFHEVEYTNTVEDYLYSLGAFAGVYAGANTLQNLGSASVRPGWLLAGGHQVVPGFKSNFIVGAFGGNNLFERGFNKTLGKTALGKGLASAEGLNFSFMNFSYHSNEAYKAAGGMSNKQALLPGVNVTTKGRMAKHLNSVVDFTEGANDNALKAISKQKKTLEKIDSLKYFVDSTDDRVDDFVKTSIKNAHKSSAPSGMKLKDLKDGVATIKKEIIGSQEMNEYAEEAVQKYLKNGFANTDDSTTTLRNFRRGVQTTRNNAKVEYVDNYVDKYVSESIKGAVNPDKSPMTLKELEAGAKGIREESDVAKNKISKLKKIAELREQNNSFEIFDRDEIVKTGSKLKNGELTEFASVKAKEIVGTYTDEMLLKTVGNSAEAIADENARTLLAEAAEKKVGGQILQQSKNAAFAASKTGKVLTGLGRFGARSASIFFSVPVQAAFAIEAAVNISSTLRTNWQLKQIKEWQASKQSQYFNPYTNAVIQKAGQITQNNNNELNMLLSSSNIAKGLAGKVGVN